jgi:hypothetical protein
VPGHQVRPGIDVISILLSKLLAQFHGIVEKENAAKKGP